MSLLAQRGYIYTWQKYSDYDDSPVNLCVVVSSEERQKDNICSIIFLTTDRGQRGDDIIPIKFNREKYILRTDLVTYTTRDYLLEKVGNIPKQTMKEIDRGILKAFGLSSKIDWEQMYNNLLNNVIKRG